MLKKWFFFHHLSYIILLALCSVPLNSSTASIRVGLLGFVFFVSREWGLTSLWKMLFTSQHVLIVFEDTGLQKTTCACTHTHTGWHTKFRSQLATLADRRAQSQEKSVPWHYWRMFDVSGCPLLKASVKHDCVFDLSCCSVQSTELSFSKLFKLFYVCIQRNGKNSGRWDEEERNMKQMANGE